MIPGAALSLFALGLLFVTGHSERDDIPYIVVCLVVFMLFNAGGLQLMGWLTGSEIYPLAVVPPGRLRPLALHRVPQRRRRSPSRHHAALPTAAR